MNQSRSALFRGRHFRDDIIVLCVRWYLRYPLSYRDLEQMMAESGLTVDHSTIARCVLHYAPVLEQRIRPQMRRPNRSGESMKRTFGWQDNGVICIGQWIRPATRLTLCCRQNETALLPKAFCSLRSQVTVGLA